MNRWLTLLLSLSVSVGNIVALTPGDLGTNHQVKLFAPRGYLPTVPVLIRVEVRNATGRPERDLWDAEAVLTTDDPAVVLSTNRVKLYNGLGSAMVTFTGGGEFGLTATVGSLSALRVMDTLAGAPQTLVSGTLPGTSSEWTGVILITGDVTVPVGHTLTIASNTVVLINGVASGTTANDIFVNGRINSLGTEDDPVVITCASAALRWGQIRHDNAQPSLYRWTTITRGGRATGEGHTGTAPVIRPTNSRVVFDHCNLTDYAEQIRGGAGFGTPGKVMMASGADIVFDGCLLSRARMGPEVGSTAVLCTNTWILEMPGPDDADGIYLHDQIAGQQIRLVDCVMARGDDDGIDTLGSIIEVENCVVRDWDNRLEDAKGISVLNGATHVRRCLVVNCTTGIAAKSGGSTPSTTPVLVTINNTTLVDNLTNVWANRKSTAVGPNVHFNITNSVLWGGLNPVHSDFEPTSSNSTNFTLVYCDIAEPYAGTGNLMLDPMFVNPALDDYRLRPFSPCIDSGSPLSPPDPDGTREEMGWRPFEAPHPILSNARLVNNDFQLVLDAYTNRNYVIAVSPDGTAWSDIATVFQTNSPSIFTDTNGIGPAERLYRARLWP